MRPREILSRNLRALMEARSDLSTIRKIVAASGGTLSNGKVGRITAASHTTDVDTLEALAVVFDVEPWQLLVEGLEPSKLPALRSETLSVEARKVGGQYDQLTEAQRSTWRLLWLGYMARASEAGEKLPPAPPLQARTPASSVAIKHPPDDVPTSRTRKSFTKKRGAP